MVKGLYSYIKKVWKKPTRELTQSRMIEWRAGESVVKVDRPLRLDRARALGYKAKKGVMIARVKIRRGGRKRTRPNKGRRSKRQTVRKVLKMNYKWVAEGRAAQKFKNMEVLNSYWIGKDGKNYFYEVILVDPDKPEIKSDRTLGWIAKAGKGRVTRGKTSSGQKSRGLQSKSGKSSKLKVRPSIRAQGRRGK